jgi:hypothetical protein
VAITIALSSMIPSSHAANDAFKTASKNATSNIFEDVIVVTGDREPVFTNSQFMEAASIPVIDAAALVGKLPGAALINNGGLSDQMAYRGFHLCQSRKFCFVAPRNLLLAICISLM